MTVSDQLVEIARDAGVTAWVHATRLSGPTGEVTLAGDEPVAMASLYKLPLASAWADLVSAGALDGGERLTFSPEDRCPGPTGIAMLYDEVSLTLRDTVRLMLAVSDNAAGDVVLQHVGADRLARWLADAGLTNTVVRHGSAESLRIVQRETGATSTALAERALAHVEHDVVTSQYDPALAGASTAGELCQVLRVLWSRTGPAHSLVRDSLAHQAWRHRIASGFPHDDVAVHGKTGTLGRLRHEAAVIGFPDEHPVAVTVLTRAARAERHLPRVDAAIGEMARVAVGSLRMPAAG